MITMFGKKIADLTQEEIDYIDKFERVDVDDDGYITHMVRIKYGGLIEYIYDPVDSSLRSMIHVAGIGTIPFVENEDGTITSVVQIGDVESVVTLNKDNTSSSVTTCAKTGVATYIDFDENGKPISTTALSINGFSE